ncbi:MAG: Mth938-like domain-containing protein [Alphaproteobacteria bacterium]
MDVTPIAPAGRQVIDSYQPGGFRVSGVVHDGSILVFPDHTEPWPVAAPGEVTFDALARVVAADPPIEVLLVGCGRRMAPLPASLRAALREAGLGVDAMDTGAACRTYNVLLSEARRVAAALIAL